MAVVDAVLPDRVIPGDDEVDENAKASTPMLLPSKSIQIVANRISARFDLNFP